MNLFTSHFKFLTFVAVLSLTWMTGCGENTAVTGISSGLGDGTNQNGKITDNKKTDNKVIVPNPSDGGGGTNSCTPGSVPKAAPASLLVMAPDAAGAFTLVGRGKVSVSGSAYVNSKSKLGGIVAGAADAQAENWYFGGGYGEIGGGNFVATSGKSGIHTKATPAADYLASVPAPDISKLEVKSASKLRISADKSLSPGIYVGGIEISGQAKVAMEPGVYVLKYGGLRVKDRASLSGDGVLFYHVGSIKPGYEGRDCHDDDNDDYDDRYAGIDAFDLRTEGDVKIVAIKEGPQQGIAYFDRESVSFVSLLCRSSAKIVGTFYAPNSRVYVLGKNDLAVSSAFIVRRFLAAGDNSVQIGSSAAQPVPPVCQ